MRISLDDPTCKICGKTHNNLRGLSQHLKKHNITSLQYTIKYLLGDAIPKCECGCGSTLKVFPFHYCTYRSGHNPECFWQLKYDKDSPEFKEIANKIATSVSEYLAEHPIVVSDETRKLISDRMKITMSDEDEKNRRFTKMRETKQQQSADGILQERHWTRNWDDDAVAEKLKEMGSKSSETKRQRYSTGETVVWNKGLTAEFDERVQKVAGENNYRYNGGFEQHEIERKKYTRKFRNKEYRAKILNSQDCICFWCKKSDTNLCLHHVDEDKENDNFDNLIFLCKPCHIKVHSVPKYLCELTENVRVHKLEIPEQYKIFNFT